MGTNPLGLQVCLSRESWVGMKHRVRVNSYSIFLMTPLLIHYMVDTPCSLHIIYSLCLAISTLMNVITHLLHALASTEFSKWKIWEGYQIVGKREDGILFYQSLRLVPTQFWPWLHPSTLQFFWRHFHQPFLSLPVITRTKALNHLSWFFSLYLQLSFLRRNSSPASTLILSQLFPLGSPCSKVKWKPER